MRERLISDKMQKELIIKYYNDLLPIKKIAREYHVVKNTILSNIQKYKNKNKNWTDLITNKIYEAIIERWLHNKETPTSILKDFGIEDLSVWSRIRVVLEKKYNISKVEMDNVSAYLKIKRAKDTAKKSYYEKKKDLEDWFIKDIKLKNRSLFYEIQSKIANKTFEEISKEIDEIERRNLNRR